MVPPVVAVAPIRAPSLHPLTEAQLGLWYALKLSPNNPIFNTGQIVRLHGPLDLAAFRAAVDTAFIEADALALRLVEASDGPRLTSTDVPPPTLTIIDNRAEKDPEAAARADLLRDMGTACDPTRDPLACARLYRLSDTEALWYQRIHHLVVDGFGTALLTERVADLYRARVLGVPAGPALTPLEAVLAEDAAYRSGSKRAEDRAYWQAAFADPPDVIGLSPGPAVTATTFHRETRALGDALITGLTGLATTLGLPWPDVITGLIAAYYRRHVGSDEVVLGVTHMGRMGSAAARTPAMTMNILPLRARIDEDAPLGSVLTGIARRLGEGRRHGQYRSEQIRRDLGLLGGDRRLYGPLLNILPFQSAPAFPGVGSRVEMLSTGPVDDLTLTLRADPLMRHATLDLDANPTLYTADRLRAHADRLLHMLNEAVAAKSITDIPTATAAEARRLVHEVNATDHPVPDTTLAALIEATMERTPEALAVVFEGISLTYRDLAHRSAALAAVLARRGIGRGDIVAVAQPRSLALIVALVAILRLGAAYLPLDAEQPAARLARIFASARPKALLGPASTPVAPPGDCTLIVLTETPAPDTARHDARWSGAGPDPDDAAYVIYTSGSTGVPKGVVIEHRAIVNRLAWMRETYGIGPGDRILQKTPATFDVSVWEFFLPLIAGATLVVAAPGAHRVPAEIASLIRRERVTTVHFVPSMLAAFLADPAAQGLTLARVFCSGEELTAPLRDRFHATVSAELHNLYGPTEAAVDVTAWDAAASDTSDPVPIGRPVWNTRLYVLDRRLRPLPPGVAGDLYIGGAQLAREYLGAPDLTIERFPADPFQGAGVRMYRTGDLARWRDDGALVFLGRTDHQVKIRGLRIELGEIEAALTAADDVAEAVVVVREDRPGDRRIVAYVVLRGSLGAAFDAAPLRRHVAEHVPGYMVPSAFVPIAARPVTANGKLDRAALPAPRHDDAVARTEAGTETGRRLANLFAAVLGLPGAVGADGDFFSLGGDSLLAIQLMLRVRETWGWDPGLGAVFEHPTVTALARVIDHGPLGRRVGTSPIIRLVEGPAERPPLFAIHPAGGIAWCYRTLAQGLRPVRTVYGIQSPSLDPAVPTPASLERLADDYAKRILDLYSQGPVHLLGWSAGGILAQAVAVRLRDLGQPMGTVTLLDAYPAERWHDQPEPDEGAALKALLHIAGYDPTDDQGLILTRDAVIGFLRRSGTPLGMLSDAVLDGVIRAVHTSNRLVQGHRHRRYDGPLIHVRAALDDHEGLTLSPQDWTPHAAALDRIDVPSLHAHLTGPEAATHLGPALSARMVAAEGRF